MVALAHRRFEDDLRHRGRSSASGGLCSAVPLASRHLTHGDTYSGSETFLVLPSVLYPHLTLSQISFHKSRSPRAALQLSSHPHSCGSLLTIPFPPMVTWSFRASLHWKGDLRRDLTLSHPWHSYKATVLSAHPLSFTSAPLLGSSCSRSVLSWPSQEPLYHPTTHLPVLLDCPSDQALREHSGNTAGSCWG